MITVNPFSELAELIPNIAMQAYVVAMVILVFGGTMLDMAHKKSAKFFFNNSEKAAKFATNHLSTGDKTAIALKTMTEDVLTAGEFCSTKRRIAHLFNYVWLCVFCRRNRYYDFLLYISCRKKLQLYCRYFGI